MLDNVVQVIFYLIVSWWGDGKEFYFGGKISNIDGCDKDLMSLPVVDATVEALGYKEMFMSYYYVIPNMEIFNGLRKIEGDVDMMV
ncbi:unnamed protein product [Malus baccata var. baccata]